MSEVWFSEYSGGTQRVPLVTGATGGGDALGKFELIAPRMGTLERVAAGNPQGVPGVPIDAKGNIQLWGLIPALSGLNSTFNAT